MTKAPRWSQKLSEVLEFERTKRELLKTTFNKLTDVGPQIAIVGSHELGPDTQEYKFVHELARLSAKMAGAAVKTTGGLGIPEAANKGCRDANANRPSIGITAPFARTRGQSNNFMDITLPQHDFGARHDALFHLTSAIIVVRGRMRTLFTLMDRSNRGKHRLVEPTPVYVLGDEWESTRQLLTRNFMLDWPLLSHKDLIKWEVVNLRSDPEQLVRQIVQVGMQQVRHLYTADYLQYVLAKEARKQTLITHAYEKLSRVDRQVVFFGSRKLSSDTPEYQYVRRAACLLATRREKFASKSGSGPGIMEAANRGCSEARCVPSIGIRATFLAHTEGDSNEHVDIELPQDDFSTRNDGLFWRSCAAVFMQRGRLGTLHELIDLLTRIHSGLMEAIPIYLVGGDFWRTKLEALTREIWPGWSLLSHKDLSLCQILDDDPEELVEKIARDTRHVCDYLYGRQALTA